MSISDLEYRRRNAILATLGFYPLATVRLLITELETVHGLAASADVVRSDLAWLAELGLVNVQGDSARCTERGADVAHLRAKFPVQPS